MERIKKLCEETNTSYEDMRLLIAYYQDSLGWDEETAIQYAIGLFQSGTIEALKFTGQKGEEI